MRTGSEGVEDSVSDLDIYIIIVLIPSVGNEAQYLIFKQQYLIFKQ